MMRFILVLLLAVLAWRVVDHHRSRGAYAADAARRAPPAAAPLIEAPPPPATLPTAAAIAATPALPATSAYRCDGRTMCSQMHSCDEAKYFLQNCPGTKMDGNHDGVPCEQQWCR